MSDKKPLCVFDICGTLFLSNTTFDFISYYHKANHNPWKYLISCVLSGIIGKVFHRFLKVDIRAILIFTLKGECQENLNSLAFEFYDSWLLNCINHEAFVMLRKCCRDQNVKVILISASIDPVVQAIGLRLGVAFEASRLSYDSSCCCKGVVERENSGMKQVLVKGENVELVVTDNLDDLNLCMASKSVVVFSKLKNLNYWNSKLGNSEIDYVIYEY